MQCTEFNMIRSKFGSTICWKSPVISVTLTHTLRLVVSLEFWCHEEKHRSVKYDSKKQSELEESTTSTQQKQLILHFLSHSLAVLYRLDNREQYIDYRIIRRMSRVSIVCDLDLYRRHDVAALSSAIRRRCDD